MIQAIITILLLVLCPYFADAKNLQSMSKADIINAFVNNTSESIGVDNLNDQTVHSSNIVYLDNKGNIVGKLGRKIPNSPQYDQGKYSIQKDGTLMIKWNHWDFSKQLCFNMFEVKNAYLSIDCKGVYHSTFMKSDIKPGKHL